MVTWIFFEEGNEATPEFEIETKYNDFEEAYELAYEKYGPQVEFLHYTVKV